LETEAVRYCSSVCCRIPIQWVQLQPS